VMYFVLSRGQHPFGPIVERELNITRNKYCLSGIDHLPYTARCLIEAMIQPRSVDRLTSEEVLHHPFFWSSEKQLRFLMDTSDVVEENPDAYSPIRRALESEALAVVGPDWSVLLLPELISNLGKYRKYDYTSVRDCLRVIRNKKHHYNELSTDLKRKLGGSMPVGFLNYFLAQSRFPKLLMHAVDVMMAHEYAGVDGKSQRPTFNPPFDEYFRGTEKKRLDEVHVKYHLKSRAWNTPSAEWMAG
jgi:serine/threonine-protein kinase/endoribonuclease IRE1